MKSILLLLGIIFSSTVYGQSNNDSAKTVFTFTYNMVTKSDSIKQVKKQQANQKDSTIITGKLIDASSQEVIVFATVLYTAGKGSNKISSNSNVDGEFRLAIPRNLLKRKFTLTVSSIGFETKLIRFRKKQLPLPYQTILLKSNIILLD
jgi:hypothetical protein